MVPIPKNKTREEIYKEFKKSRRIKHIETSDDIDVAFQDLPKRLRTRITKKQLRYVMNSTTMGDIVGHLIDNEKSGIVKAPKQKEHKYTPGKNMAEQVSSYPLLIFRLIRCLTLFQLQRHE